MTTIASMSVRVAPAGPPVANRMTVDPPARDAAGTAAIVILIHGYNASTKQARQTYSTFVKALERAAGRALSIPVYEFHWPGDEVNPVYSALSYANKIDVALRAGDRLGEYLAGVRGPGGGPMDVHVVAHSLGNRVLMGMLRRVAAVPMVMVRSATMMAAAIPVGLVTYPGPYFRACCVVPEKTLAMHSIADVILGGIFRAGETRHGEAFLPEAVGWLGHPTEYWSAHRAYNTFGHGDYWEKSGPAEQVAELLGQAPPRQTNSAGTAGRKTARRNTAKSAGLA